MKAIILAAGTGTRLGGNIPKPLTPLLDEMSIMDFQVERLSALIGMNNILVVVGYKKELIMEKFPQLQFAYNPAFARTNTSKSLHAGLQKFDDDVIWLNGDVYFELEAISDLLRSSEPAALVVEGKCGEEEIKYKLNPAGNIIELSKIVVSGAGEAVGINLITKSELPKLVRALNDVGPQDYFEKALENLVTTGDLVLKPRYTNGAFCTEIDFPEDLDRVKKHLSTTETFRNAEYA